MPAIATRKRRPGHPRFVVAIDIGTTCSGVSYCIERGRGETFVFQEVNRWPKQTRTDAKIPSVIYYDDKGKPRLHGAETEDEASIGQADMNGWKKAEWWKMLLFPDYLGDPASVPTSLPPGVSVDQVLRDMLVYMIDNLKVYVERSHPVKGVWEFLRQDMELVLTIPNGWEGQQQHRMRRAAIESGIISEDEGKKVRFVSEGEAAVHYCMGLPDIEDCVKNGETVVVCDAGGGTIDINAYLIADTSGLLLEEVTAPACELILDVTMKLITGGLFDLVGAY